MSIRDVSRQLVKLGDMTWEYMHIIIAAYGLLGLLALVIASAPASDVAELAFGGLAVLTGIIIVVSMVMAGFSLIGHELKLS